MSAIMKVCDKSRVICFEELHQSMNVLEQNDKFLYCSDM